MSLEWTHGNDCPLGELCPWTDCVEFPTVGDRISAANEAYEEYAEEYGNTLDDFVTDVMLLAHQNAISLDRCRSKADREWEERQNGK